MKLLALVCIPFFAVSSFASIVEFHIAPGTISNPWNTHSTSIKATVGDTIRFYNDDSVVHRLHTYGAPCEHGPDFEPGATFDCVTIDVYSSAADGPLYDHNYGEAAEVWFEVVK